MGDSGPGAVFCEDADQVAKIAAVRERLPDLEHIIVIDPKATRRRDHARRRCASAGAAATAAELAGAPRRGRARRSLHVHLHVGHHRPAEGLRALARQLPRDADMCEGVDVVHDGRGRLPVPAARPLVRAADPAARLRRRRDASPTSAATPQQIVAELERGQADLPPVGAAHLREDLHAGHGVLSPRPEQLARRDRGRRARCATQARGQEVPEELKAPFEQAEAAAVLQRARGLRRPAAPGGHGRRADRARDPRVLLRLRRARARGLRHDRDRDRRRRTRPSRTTSSAPSGARCPAARSRSPTTARC